MTFIVIETFISKHQSRT